MTNAILADSRHTTTRENIKQAIVLRTTRGLLTFNTGRVHRLEGALWAVPSTRGGWHKVDLDQEACDCEDWTFFGRDHGVACRHIYAAAIANGTRRSGVQVRIISVAGDPFAAAAAHDRRGCSRCFDGVVYMGVEEDGQEHHEAVPCRRCSAEGEEGGA
jgi:hypothetical protein